MKIFEDSIKNTTYIPPQWPARRANYTYKLININKTNKCETNNPMDVYLQFNNKYINPLDNGDFMLSDVMNPYSNKFYIIEKYDSSKFMTNYENSVENQEQPVFNFLYYARLVDTFIIYSDIKNYEFNDGGFGPSVLFLNIRYNSSNGRTNIKANNYFNGDNNLQNLQIKFKNDHISIKDQLWQIVESTINTSIPLEIKTSGETKYIEFERNIQSFKDNNVTLSTNLNTYSNKDGTFSNTNKNSKIRIYYIVNDPIYKDYYIFQNEFGEFLSIYNKSRNDCIYENIGLYWNDSRSSLDSVYANNSKPNELTDILNMNKSENTFVFKIISNKILTFDNLWHSNFKDNNLISLKILKSPDHNITFEGYLTTSTEQRASRDNISTYAIVHKFRLGLWQIIDGHKNCSFKLKILKRFDYEAEGYLSFQNSPNDKRDGVSIFLAVTQNKDHASRFIFEDDGYGNKLIKLVKNDNENDKDNKLYIASHRIFDRDKINNESILAHMRWEGLANFKVEIPNQDILDEMDRLAEQEQKKIEEELERIRLENERILREKQRQEEERLEKLRREAAKKEEYKKQLDITSNNIANSIIKEFTPILNSINRIRRRRKRRKKKGKAKNIILDGINKIKPEILKDIVFRKLQNFLSNF